MSRLKRIRFAIQAAKTVLGLIVLPGIGQASEVHYHCADGATLIARFRPDHVDLKVTGGVVSLPQTRSADGGRYRGSDLTFWIKGRGADLTRGAMQTHCSVFP